MNLARHYRTLGLRRGASAREVKSAYRTLVRQYHPDINPDEAAVEQFLKINDAYTILSEAIQAGQQRSEQPDAKAIENAAVQRIDDLRVDELREEQSEGSSGFDGRLQSIRLTLERLGFNTFADSQAAEPYSSSSVDNHPPVERTDASAAIKEETLKQKAYAQLKGLLKQQKFPRAIALVEGLAHRMPQDAEITQWQAIVYQRWGRQLIQEGQTHKARIYLKKALRTDPNNRALWREVNRDFWRLASLGN